MVRSFLMIAPVVGTFVAGFSPEATAEPASLKIYGHEATSAAHVAPTEAAALEAAYADAGRSAKATCAAQGLAGFAEETAVEMVMADAGGTEAMVSMEFRCTIR